jgi:hypothetical protein
MNRIDLLSKRNIFPLRFVFSKSLLIDKILNVQHVIHETEERKQKNKDSTKGL